MKQIRFIGFLTLAFFVACNSNKQVPEPVEGPSKELSAIDSLLWQQPDSALTCLLPYFDTCKDTQFSVSTATAYDRHYANLLLAELLYKNDYAQTNRPALRRAVAYFDSLTFTLNDHSSLRRLIAGGDPLSPTRNDQLVFLSARAHYINGVGYYEHDSVVEACQEYLKALEVMEEHFEEKELVGHIAQFMAMTYTRLTVLFSDLYLHEQALYFGKKSLFYYHNYEAAPGHVAWVLNNIGSRYDIMDKFDSAYYYYSQGLDCISDTNSLTYRGIATHIAFLSYKMGLPSNNSLNQLYILLAQSKDNVEYISRCLTIGEIYYHEQQLDSAWLYLNKVYNQSQRVGSKKQAAEWLVTIAEAQGKNSEALEYASFLVPFANLEENQSGIKSQLTALYNDFKQARLDYQQYKEKQKRTRIRLSVFGVLSLAIFFLFVRSIKHKKALETERHAYNIQQAALAGRLRRSNAIIKEQEKKQASASASPSHQHQISTDDYLDEPICKHILDVCNDKSNPIKSTIPVSAYASIKLSDNQKAQLKDAALGHYGQLFETLKKMYPELKERDLFYCYLCLLGLDNVQIAVLQQKSISTIWDRENRLKKIFESENKVSVILHGFMNN